MKRRDFDNTNKYKQSLLSSFEQNVIDRYVRIIPAWLQTHHLTLLTLLWTILIALTGFLATYNSKWLFASSLIIIFQYSTDLFDGHIGRLRNTGLVKWGYFMDHLLDYLFQCAIYFGYFLLLHESYKPLFLIMTFVFTGYMIHSFLLYTTTGVFRRVYFRLGPTEFRVILLCINATIIFLGISYFEHLLPIMTVLLSIGYVLSAYDIQKQLWKRDQMNKRKTDMTPIS